MSSGFRATRAGVASAVADGSRPRASQTSSNTVSSLASAGMRIECTLPPLAKCSVTDAEAEDTGAIGVGTKTGAVARIDGAVGVGVDAKVEGADTEDTGAVGDILGADVDERLAVTRGALNHSWTSDLPELWRCPLSVTTCVAATDSKNPSM